MNSEDNPNPYTPTSFSDNQCAVEGLPLSLTADDLAALRVGSRRTKGRFSLLEPYLWPTIALLISLYQFWMCWTVSQNSGIPFSELIAQDGAGFPADSYNGGLLRMFDRFVTGACILVASAFLYFIAWSDRKRDLQNHRFHVTMLESGLLPPEDDSGSKSD